MSEMQLQRACSCGGGCFECKTDPAGREQERLQTKRVQPSDTGQTEAPPIVHEVLASPGQPLDSVTRSFMEPRFGHDFARVRVHADAKAAESARAVNALAYTAGWDVVFGAGQYQPNTSAGRQLLAHELSHTIQQGAAVRSPIQPGVEATTTAAQDIAPMIQRAMKFELQTGNVVWRTGRKDKKGTKLPDKKLPRKFGPKDQYFLHKGTKGKKAKAGKEGTAVELQSEEGGFVEFETPKWFRDWCELKERIQEAVDMVEEIKKSKVVGTSDDGYDLVDFPFGVSHLKASETFKGGLKKGESLVVEIRDPDWNAKIQSSETFELQQYESFLKEHEDATRATSTITTAQKILDNALKASPKIKPATTDNLRGFLQIVVNYILNAQYWDTSGSPAKDVVALMSRTSFSSMYRSLLSKEEQELFREIVKNDVILNEMGLTRTSKFYKYGFKGQDKPFTVYAWLLSITKKGKDLLSHPAGGSQAMGRFDVETKPGKKDTNLVKFETRQSTKFRASSDPRRSDPTVIPASKWVAYAKEVFKEAYTKRARMGDTALIYDPSACP